MSEYQVPVEKESWLENTISSFLSYRDDDRPLGTPQEMIDEAAQKAFNISTALGLLPGPLGIASILPEMVALTKVHATLIYRIAKHYNRHERVNEEIILLVLANVMGVAMGEALVRKVGARIIVRAVDSALAKRLARTVGSAMVKRAAEKAMGRWIPLLTAPLFGYFSRSLTKKVGEEANRLFSKELEIEFSRA